MNDTIRAHMALVSNYYAAVTQTFREGADEQDDSNLHAAWMAIQASALALQAEQAEPGFVMVPVEPNADMMNAAMDCQDADPEDGLSGEIYATYKAMLAARPSEPPKAPVEPVGEREET